MKILNSIIIGVLIAFGSVTNAFSTEVWTKYVSVTLMDDNPNVCAELGHYTPLHVPYSSMWGMGRVVWIGCPYDMQHCRTEHWGDECYWPSGNDLWELSSVCCDVSVWSAAIPPWSLWTGLIAALNDPAPIGTLIGNTSCGLYGGVDAYKIVEKSFQLGGGPGYECADPDTYKAKVIWSKCDGWWPFEHGCRTWLIEIEVEMVEDPGA